MNQNTNIIENINTLLESMTSSRESAILSLRSKLDIEQRNVNFEELLDQYIEALENILTIYKIGSRKYREKPMKLPPGYGMHYVDLDESKRITFARPTKPAKYKPPKNPLSKREQTSNSSAKRNIERKIDAELRGRAREDFERVESMLEVVRDITVLYSSKYDQLISKRPSGW
jgi:hypothetical protein